jgi:hypothetical protein
MRFTTLLVALMISFFSTNLLAAPDCMTNTCNGAQICTVGTMADDFCEIDEASVPNLAELAAFNFSATSLPSSVDNIVSDALFFDNVVVTSLATFDYIGAPEAFHPIKISSSDSTALAESVSIGFGRYLPGADNAVSTVTVVSGSYRVNGGSTQVLSLSEGESISPPLNQTIDFSNIALGANILALQATDSANVDSDDVLLMLPRYPLPAVSIDTTNITLVEAWLGSIPNVGAGTPLVGVADNHTGSVVTAGILPVNSYQVVGVRSLDTVNNRARIAFGLPLPDSDGDGIVDALDAFPFDALDFLDTDGDGMGDFTDLDDDGDGRADDVDAFPLDRKEFLDTDGDLVGNNADTDDDGDGLDDAYEVSKGLYPLISNVGTDTDNDGIDDVAEFALGTDPAVVDSDGDGLSDGDEIAAGLDPTVQDQATIAHQLITPSSTVIRIPVGSTAAVSWSYDTSDAQNLLNGLVLRVHYDNRFLTWDVNNEVMLGTGFVSRTDVADSADFDSEPASNRYIEYVWDDALNAWPGTLPAMLLSAQFTLANTLEPFAFTSIRLSNGTAAERIENGLVTRYRVLGDEIRVGVGDSSSFSLDVTGDGEFDPFTDGVIINRFLLGYPVIDIANDAELVGATRSRQQIFELLQQARVF